MQRSQLDLHPAAGWDTAWCFDLGLSIIEEAFHSRHTKRLFNGCPFINKAYKVDQNGGGFLITGKSGHSTSRVHGTNLVTFRPSAGENNAKFFFLLKLTSNCNCGKGAIFADFSKFHSDAGHIMAKLRKFGNRTASLVHFNRIVAVLKKYCRKQPNNISPKDKLDVHGSKLFTSIYNNSELSFDENDVDCSANRDIMLIAELAVKLLLELDVSTLRLSRFLSNSAIEYFLKTRCNPYNDSLQALVSNPQIIFDPTKLC